VHTSLPQRAVSLPEITVAGLVCSGSSGGLIVSGMLDKFKATVFRCKPIPGFTGFR